MYRLGKELDRFILKDSSSPKGKQYQLSFRIKDSIVQLDMLSRLTSPYLRCRCQVYMVVRL